MFEWNDGIPDEMFASYLDGNATDFENMIVENAINNDCDFAELSDVVADAISMSERLDLKTAETKDNIDSFFKTEATDNEVKIQQIDITKLL